MAPKTEAPAMSTSSNSNVRGALVLEIRFMSGTGNAQLLMPQVYFLFCLFVCIPVAAARDGAPYDGTC